jgi:hypothetical protein
MLNIHRSPSCCYRRPRAAHLIRSGIEVFNALESPRRSLKRSTPVKISRIIQPSLPPQERVSIIKSRGSFIVRSFRTLRWCPERLHLFACQPSRCTARIVSVCKAGETQDVSHGGFTIGIEIYCSLFTLTNRRRQRPRSTMAPETYIVVNCSYWMDVRAVL